MFINRHIELDNKQGHSALSSMLTSLSLDSVEQLVDKVLPKSIKGLKTKSDTALSQLPPALDEQQALALVQEIGNKNQALYSLIGQGYSNSIMPSVIKRNVFENPGWYTSYTAYQAEISQGRLEALFNFQTLTSELTGLPIANASLLDEGTAVAEAALLAHRYFKANKNNIAIIDGLHPQSEEVLRTRSETLNIALSTYSTAQKFIESHPLKSNSDITDNKKSQGADSLAAVIVQLPHTNGTVYDIASLVAHAHSLGALVIAAVDPMFMLISKSPATWNIDIAVGSFQRFGIPLGFGGPHAAYFACTDALKRLMPGRVVGQSVDTKGRKAYRFALQTREQHIRREKATSNICTSQVFLAVLSSMYAVYHGNEGLRSIALRIFSYAHRFVIQLQKAGFKLVSETYFDTISWKIESDSESILTHCRNAGYNIRRLDNETLSIAFDECMTEKDFQTVSLLLELKVLDPISIEQAERALASVLPTSIIRKDSVLTQAVFEFYRTETEMMRYIRRLMDKDLALDRTMIPLGSCTMKLNAASELMPLSWENFANIHPFAPLSQAKGYLEIIQNLEDYLCKITGYDAMSLQPNAGSQGEYAGLLAIKAYHQSRGESKRNICLIPSSAHGTNPASAQMANLQVVIVQCDEQGNIDLSDLKAKAELHTDNLAALMITYPSTHGVYEASVRQVCDIVHEHRGQVYIDGANLNALVGLVQIAELGADVSHLNLHKTFSIPHGGGGPGVGPVGVKAHLAPFLPKNMAVNASTVASTASKIDVAVGAVSSAPWGSALALLISWMYIRMMGAEGLTQASARAVLHANYIAKILSTHYSILYTGEEGMVAHECIIDMREFKKYGIEVEDIAKRLIDFGFHAPTMSWPVAGTLMIEPTESESKQELDRFCNAMIAIKQELDKVANGIWSKEDNPLVNAPHTAEDICTDSWNHSYTRKEAAYPFESYSNKDIYTKYWAPVSRIDSAYGDKNLICSCPPLDSY